jgi:hypothetical protein
MLIITVSALSWTTSTETDQPDVLLKICTRVLNISKISWLFEEEEYFLSYSGIRSESLWVQYKYDTEVPYNNIYKCMHELAPQILPQCIMHMFTLDQEYL